MDPETSRILNNRINLGFFPTPLQFLKRLSKQYSGYNIYIKRDDHTGLATGGNKTRKLEYLLKAALDEGCDTIITSGAQQSNHCRQTAAACAVTGLECHLLLGGNEPETYNGNLLLSKLMGSFIHFTGNKRKGEDSILLKEELEKKGKKCYLIPYGGSNITGALGFVNAMLELKKQLSDMNLDLDHIFFASSSGGMQAGLTLGGVLVELSATLNPISIDKEETYGNTLQENVLKIVNEGQKLLGSEEEFRLSDIRLAKGYDAAGYGVITKNEISALKELAQYEGILLDPVYTGRAFYGMTDHLKRNIISKGSNVLFWHTGGLPANFYYANELGD